MGSSQFRFQFNKLRHRGLDARPPQHSPVPPRQGGTPDLSGRRHPPPGYFALVQRGWRWWRLQARVGVFFMKFHVCSKDSTPAWEPRPVAFRADVACAKRTDVSGSKPLQSATA